MPTRATPHLASSSSGGSVSFRTAQEALPLTREPLHGRYDGLGERREQEWAKYPHPPTTFPPGIARAEWNNPAGAGTERAAAAQPRMPPTLSKGLLDRLKAQRHAQTAPLSATVPSSPHPPPLVSPPLQPFASPPANSSREPALAFPDASGNELPALSQSQKLQGPPRWKPSSVRAPEADLVEPPVPSSLPSARRSRSKLSTDIFGKSNLQGARRGNPASMLAAHRAEQPQASESPPFSEPFVAYDRPWADGTSSVNSKREDRQPPATAQPRTSPNPQESGSPSIDYEQVLAQGPLLLPPLDRPMTDGLLAFNDLWKPCYAILTPHDLTVQLEDTNSSPLLAFEVAEVIRVERLSQHDRNGFEPFCVSLVDGSHFFAAAADQLGGAFWTLKIENARSGAFRRSPDLRRLSANRPSLASQRHSSQKTARESLPVPLAPSTLPAASSRRPFSPPGFAHEPTIPSSTQLSPHRLDATSPPLSRSSGRIGLTQTGEYVAAAHQSSETATGDDRKHRRRRMQELFLDVEARFHEQQQQQMYNYEAQQHIAQVVSDILELAERDSEDHEAAIVSLTSQLDDIFANERNALPSPSSSPSPPPAPPSALLSPVSPRSTMPIDLKKVKQRPEATLHQRVRVTPPAPEASRLLRKRSVPLRKGSTRPFDTAEPGTVTQSATSLAPKPVASLPPRPHEKLVATLETPGLPEKVARTVYETVERARRTGEAEKQATTRKKKGTTRKD